MEYRRGAAPRICRESPLPQTAGPPGSKGRDRLTGDEQAKPIGAVRREAARVAFVAKRRIPEVGIPRFPWRSDRHPKGGALSAVLGSMPMARGQHRR